MTTGPEMTPNDTLDVRGEVCPYPSLRSRQKLLKMEPGQVLEILVDHPPAALESIPELCQRQGWEFLRERPGEYWRLLVRRG